MKVIRPVGTRDHLGHKGKGIAITARLTQQQCRQLGGNSIIVKIDLGPRHRSVLDLHHGDAVTVVVAILIVTNTIAVCISAPSGLSGKASR